MYSLTRTKTYSTTGRNLESFRLPLETLANDYFTILAQHKEDITRQKLEYLQYLQNQHETNYEGEGSYEGDFSELNLEEQVDNKFRGVSSAKATTELVKQFCIAHSITTKANWMLPAFMAELGKLNLRYNETGKISAKFLYEDHIKDNPFLTGIIILCRHPQRSSLLKGQTDPLSKNYCSLVPLVLSAFKSLKGIKYSEWDPRELNYVVDKNLVEVMQLQELPEISVEEILEIREAALTVKTGEKAGEVRSLISSYTLYIPVGTPISGLPMLGKIMMCQTWCAHPTVRTNLMVLNPLDWDSMPPPIIDATVTKSAPKVKLGYTPKFVTSDGWV